MAEFLGAQIKRARTRAGLSQEELATYLPITREQLSNYETGRSPSVPSEVIAAIARELHQVFEIGEVRIMPDGTPGPKLPLAEQLCFPFDRDTNFPEAIVKIRPSRDTLVITTSIPLAHHKRPA